MLRFFRIARNTYYYVAHEKPDETALEDAVETLSSTKIVKSMAAGRSKQFLKG